MSLVADVGVSPNAGTPPPSVGNMGMFQTSAVAASPTASLPSILSFQTLAVTLLPLSSSEDKEGVGMAPLSESCPPSLRPFPQQSQGTSTDPSPSAPFDRLVVRLESMEL